MSKFEFFMAFYGLLLGLGVAELLTGFANILRERTPPKVGLVTPLVGLLVLIETLANFLDAWYQFNTIDIQLTAYALPTLIGIIYYVVAVILVPRDLGEWPSLDEYFDKRRRWIVGALLAANLVVVVASLPKVFPFVMSTGPRGITLWAINLAWLFGSYLLLLFTRSRRVSIATASLLVVFYIIFYGPWKIF